VILSIFYRPKTVEENLQLWIKRIIHQTDEVRLKALLYLKQFLAKNRHTINDLILTDNNVHPLIVKVNFYFNFFIL
jgi:hypothetical protein